MSRALEAEVRRFNFIDRTRESFRKNHRCGMEEKWKMLVHILRAGLSCLMIRCWKEMNQGLRLPFLCFLYTTYHNYFLDLFFYISVSPIRSITVFLLVQRLSKTIKKKSLLHANIASFILKTTQVFTPSVISLKVLRLFSKFRSFKNCCSDYVYVSIFLLVFP